MRCRLAGVTFAPGYPRNLADLTERCEHQPVPVELVREPNNPFDLNAVGVHVEGRMLGHLPRDIAAIVGPKLDDGQTIAARAIYVAVDLEHRERPGLEIEIGRA